MRGKVLWKNICKYCCVIVQTLMTISAPSAAGTRRTIAGIAAAMARLPMA
jgi:hypothetical protein